MQRRRRPGRVTVNREKSPAEAWAMFLPSLSRRSVSTGALGKDSSGGYKPPLQPEPDTTAGFEQGADERLLRTEPEVQCSG